MHKRIVLCITAVIMCLFASAAIAADLPTTIVVGTNENPSFTVNKEARTVTIEAPLTRGQQTTDKSDERIVDSKTVTLCASYAYLKADRSNWVLIDEKEYCGLTEAISADRVKMVYTLPKHEDGNNNDYILRIWGHDQAGKWLWINQSSPFNKMSKTNKPGYEVHLSLKDSFSEPVSAKIAARP
jgi:hypothetical protein